MRWRVRCCVRGRPRNRTFFFVNSEFDSLGYRLAERFNPRGVLAQRALAAAVKICNPQNGLWEGNFFLRPKRIYGGARLYLGCGSRITCVVKKRPVGEEPQFLLKSSSQGIYEVLYEPRALLIDGNRLVSQLGVHTAEQMAESMRYAMSELEKGRFYSSEPSGF